MYEKILVPLDGSTLSEHAIKPALELAKQMGTAVTFLRAAETMPVMVPDAVSATYHPDELLKEADHYLMDLADTYAHSDFTIETSVAYGTPAAAIIDLANEGQFDLIMMSSHGRSGLGRWVLGSVTERVLRQAPCPVWVVRDEALPTNVLIALDGSELAEEALGPGLEIAQQMDAGVLLVRVENPDDDFHPRDMDELSRIDPGLANLVVTDFFRKEHDYLVTVADRYKDSGLKIKIDIDRGKAARRILDVAARNDCDLIVMSTHGRTGLSRWVYGSVMEKVLRATARDMLVVRPPEHALN